MSLPTSFRCLLEMSPFPFESPTPRSTPYPPPEVITMATWVPAGRGPLWHHQGPSPGWSSVSRCLGRPEHQGLFLSAHRVVCQMVPVLLHSCVTCVHVMFTSLRKLKNSREEALRRTLSVWQNLPEHAQDWLEIAFSGFSSLCQCT